jgi:hypothetical protein
VNCKSVAELHPTITCAVFQIVCITAGMPINRFKDTIIMATRTKRTINVIHLVRNAMEEYPWLFLGRELSVTMEDGNMFCGRVRSSAVIRAVIVIPRLHQSSRPVAFSTAVTVFCLHD